MGFLHPAFLIGLALGAVPLLVHLFFRLKKRPVVFSTLRFLLPSQKRNRRRWQLRDIILLLLRIAFLVLLALTFARPYIRGSLLAETIRWQPEHIAIVLDDSPSMNVRYRHLTRWKPAVKEVKRLAEEAMPSHYLWLVKTSRPDRPVNRDPLQRRPVLASLGDKPGWRRGDLERAVKTAERLLADNPGSAGTLNTLVIISDFQRSWFSQQEDLEDFRAVIKRLRNSGCTVRLVDLHNRAPRPDMRGEPAQTSRDKDASLPTNIGITGARIVEQVIEPGKPVTLDVTVTASGGELPAHVLVRWKRSREILGAPADVVLEGPGEYHASIEWTPDAPGVFLSTVEVDSGDDFPADDAFNLVADLREKLNVPIISTETGADKFSSAAYYLSVAINLRPENREASWSETESAVGGIVSRYRAANFDAGALGPEILAGADALVIAGLPPFSEKQLEALGDYVRGGGGVLWFAGSDDGKIPRCYTRSASIKGDSDAVEEDGGLLGVRLSGVEEAPTAGDASGSAAVFHIKTFDKESPPFDLFANPEHGEPRLIKMERIVTLMNTASAISGKIPGVKILATATGGYPLLIRRDSARGSVFLFLTEPRGGFCDIYRRKIFVPVVHRILEELTGKRSAEKLQLECGESPAALLSRGDILESVPEGRRFPLDEVADGITVPPPGGYRVLDTSSGTDVEKEPAAVNIAAAESEMKAYAPAEITGKAVDSGKMEGKSAGTRIDDDAPYDVKRRSPWWYYLLSGAALTLLLEAGLRDFF